MKNWVEYLNPETAPRADDIASDDGCKAQAVYACTRPRGHEGAHVAADIYGLVCATWEDDD